MNKLYIANPIYDTVFKHLMENNRIARFFVETIIAQPLESISVEEKDKENDKLRELIASMQKLTK